MNLFGALCKKRMPWQGQRTANKQKQEKVFVHDDDTDMPDQRFYRTGKRSKINVSAGEENLYKEDDRNKALIYENHTVFAYTGLATLGNQKFAIDWAAELLAQPPTFQDAMVYLSEFVTRLMETHPFSGYPNDQRRLGFVGAGFINWVEATETVRRPADSSSRTS